MLEEGNWITYFIIKTLTHFASYLVLAGFSYFIFWVWKKRELIHIKIQQHFPQTSQLRSEIMWSVLNIIITGTMNIGIFFMYKASITKISVGLENISWGYDIATFILLLFLHDTYFYWIHRLMHYGKLYDIFHRVHHNSESPTPWTTHSQHPFEVILQNLFLLLTVLFLPLHSYVIGAFMATATIFNLVGHLGFEVFPRFFINSFLGKIFLSSTYHNMHHERKTLNFGLYFFFWDRVMNTYHKDYVDRFRAVTDKK